ncbi:pilin [Neisseria sp. Ec49-e6-T10]|uniref:pilin n=1 Tax=Neisseria sp. Ec49-e6-T10 TaxID=3140744 RepID=UPI003EB75488
MKCVKCGFANPEFAMNCGQCGHDLHQKQQDQTASQDFSNRAQQPQMNEATGYSYESLYGLFVGTNQAYYKKIFKRFDQQDSFVSWNWAAGFVTLFWLIYRKMWVRAVIYFFVPIASLILLSIVMAILTPFFKESIGLIFSILLFVVVIGLFLIPGLYGNSWYYRYTKNHVEQLSYYEDKQQIKRFCQQKGGGNLVAVLIACGIGVFGFIFIGGMLAAIMLPAYNDYISKAQMERTLRETAPLQEQMSHFYQQKGYFPNSPETKLKFADVQVSRKSGKITIIMNQENQYFSGKKIQLKPVINPSNKRLEGWTCTSTEIKQKFLGKQCKGV